MTMKAKWLLLACFVCLPTGSYGVTPVTNCTEFVLENEDLRCNCLLPENVSGPANLTWPDSGNYSEPGSDALTIRNVTREMNGSQFTCQMHISGYEASVNYTLLVAYGPSSDSLEVVVSNPPTHEAEEITFTCSATETYPQPQYDWTGVECRNTTENTCTLELDASSGDGILNVTCLATPLYKVTKDTVVVKSILVDMSYPAVVTKMTLNNATNRITVNETDRKTLFLHCEVYGRPSPNVTMETIGTQSSKSLSPVISQSNLWTKTASAVLSGVTCQDMGIYLCATRNRVGLGDSKIIHLAVNCPPKRLTFMETLPMTEAGIAFMLVAHPVPDTITINYHGRQASGIRRETVPVKMFAFKCQQNSLILSFVDCTILPLEVPGEFLGFYTATVSNEVGSVNVSF